MSRRDDLEKLLEYHDKLYYDDDTPEISDEEYNAIKEEFIRLNSGQDYTYVPGAVSANLKRIKHPFKVGSLEKVNTLEDVRAEIERLAPVVIEPKLDGLTLAVYDYNVMATRGNGEEGELVTDNAKLVSNLGDKNLVIPGPVRMEVFMEKETFNQLNDQRLLDGEEQFKNPRNAAAGMLRHKDSSKVKGLTYLAYNILGNHLSESEQLEVLSSSGFLTVPAIRFGKDEIDEAVKFIEEFNREDLPYEIDGLVIKNDDPNSLDRFGTTGHHPKNAVAYKFPAVGAWTTLKSVTWQVGRTGKVTPVAEIVPINIGGSTITRVTLHNEAIMSALDIQFEGDEVFVIKANDVIPAITECRRQERNEYTGHQIGIPLTCPDCGSYLRKENDQRFCDNVLCSAKTVANIVHMAKRDALDIEGLSEETAQKMYNAGLNKPYLIFDLSVKDIQALPGFAQKSAEKLYNAIQARRTVPFKKFLYAAGVPIVGRTASEDIAKTVGSFGAFVGDIVAYSNNLPSVIANLEGFGPKTMEAIKNNIEVWNKLSQYITPEVSVVNLTTKPDKVFTIVVTGSFEKDGKKVSRDEIEAMIKEAGHKASGSVSAKTDYVLVGAAAGSKETKARELGLKILNSLDELEEIL